jgi:hypothetical protein
MTYATDGAFRAALEARLGARSRDAGADLNRLRRRVVFERMLARLEAAEPGCWILKGGMALEVRWRDRARSTRDMDLAARHPLTTGVDARTALAGPLAVDADHDRFRFTVGHARDLQVDEAGRPGWRFPVEAMLAGRQFAAVRVDLVIRESEISGTERLRLPGALVFVGIGACEIEVVDRSQHFAEKLHALTRTYTSRPSTRVRDLVDLVLLIDDGLEPDARLYDRVVHVFEARASHPVPEELPDPPADWSVRYRELADDLDVSAATLDDAMHFLRAFWRQTLSRQE